nr:hypothetical protein BACY1_03210 [Tenacibaculum mesophilum]
MISLSLIILHQDQLPEGQLFFFLKNYQTDYKVFVLTTLKYFIFNQNETLTNKINAGTSTKGPITPAKACPEFNPKTAIATAIASSKLFPAV